LEVNTIVKIRICDAMMGSGKTSAAINMMRRCKDRQFVFITPFLDEVKRIKEGCAERKFVEPFFSEKKNKLESLKELLTEKKNIASTHALFKKYDDYTKALIRNGHYTLIMDEVVDVVEVVPIGAYDLDLMLQWGVIAVDENDRVHWLDDKYPANNAWSECMRTIKSGHVVMENNKLMLWLFPADVFEAFDEVIVLTHMFDAQIQRYYYDLHRVEYEYIGVNERYDFCEVEDMHHDYSWLKEKIHVLDDEKLNVIGDGKYALSVTWFDRESKKRAYPNIKRLKANAENVVRQRWGASSSEILWSTYKDNMRKLAGRGYTKGFLEFNARASNNYRDRKYLIYLVNIFLHVDIKTFFQHHDVQVLEDKYALSVMLQWIWRSAIRDGKPIWIYIPSSRMRTLLENWLNEQ